MAPILFIKVILEQSLQDGKLMIPRKFTRKHGDNLPNPVFLMPPDGTKWKINWKKHEDDIWFEKGWNEFATFYSLKYGHLVEFQIYNEASHIEVHIFDMSCLEIDYPSPQPQHEQHCNNDFVEVLDEVTPTKKRQLKSPKTHSPQPHKKLTTSTSEVVGEMSNLKHEPQNLQSNGNRIQGPNFKRTALPFVKEELNEDIGNCNESQLVDKVTSEIEAVLAKAATSRSINNPSFTVVMQPSYILGRSLNVPSKFGKIYLEGNPKDIVLQSLNGGIWSVGYSIGRFYAGWNKFVSNNNLKVGDVCLFELIKSQDVCFQVSIFGLSKETHSLLSQVQEDGASHKAPRILPYFKSQTFIPSKEVEGESSRKSSGTMKKARKFTSENPFFKVNIKPDHHHDYRPCVPMDFMRKHLSNKESVLLMSGKLLRTVSLYRYGRVPTKLSKGWKEFMKECNLVAGDVCIFELINKEETVLKVHIFRAES